MIFNPTFISRLQFAFTISFHILFPSFSIGLATFLAIMEGCWLKTKKQLYYRICKFWTKIFALTFGMGVVSGIVMEFQLGTNWGGFTKIVGPVLGALFTYEVLTAFFIEAGFLGVMIFGWERVGRKLHYCATLLVAVGVTVSAFWILSANSWMQTPSGTVLQSGHFVVNSWLHVIFNPSVMPRFIHMLLASYLSTAFVIAGISAFYLRKKLHLGFAKKCFSFALLTIIILIPVQIWVGDEAGIVDHKYQPIKTAAMEGVWNTQRGAPMLLFAYPNQREQKNQFAIGIPHLASVINTHRWNGKMVGLKSVPRADQPYVPIVFYSFRIMVGLGLLMLLLGSIGLYYRFKGTLYLKQRFHQVMQWVSPIGFVAILTGWFTAETGRQPWVVYNLVTTADGASKITVSDVITSLVLLFIIYGVVFGFFYFKYFFKVIKHGPAAKDEAPVLPFGYMTKDEEKVDE